MLAEGLRRRFRIGAVRKFTVGMEGEFQPIGIVFEFGLPNCGHVFQVKRIMVVVIERVERDFQAVLVMDFLQSRQIEMVERLLRTLFGKIREEEAMIVDEEVESFKRFFIPYKRKFLRIRPVRRHDRCLHGIDALRQFNFRRKTPSFHDGWLAVDRHGPSTFADAFNFHFQ